MMDYLIRFETTEFRGAAECAALFLGALGRRRVNLNGHGATLIDIPADVALIVVAERLRDASEPATSIRRVS